MKANSHRPRTAFSVLWALAFVFLLLAPTAAAAAPSFLLQMPEGTTATGSGAGQMDNPRGIGADAANGHVYVADLNNARIDEFNAWGGFVKAWGWDVSPEGAPGDTATDELEVCTSVCKAGVAGDGVGQIHGPYGVAVDAAGDVYVAEHNLAGSSKRVQKFSPAGEFLAMFGGEVDKTSGANVCRRADIEAGNICGAGVSGSADGFFSYNGVGNNLAYDASTNTILAGDTGRIQRFETDGSFKGKIEVPGKSIESLAVDAEGKLYAAYAGEEDIHKLSAAGSELQVSSVPRNPLSGVISVAVDSEGDVYAVDTGHSLNRVLEFDAEGNQLLPTSAEEEAGGISDFFPYIQYQGAVTPHVNGLATNLCAGSEAPGNLYISFSGGGGNANNYVNAYGTPPVGCEPPPARPPIVTAQYATAVGADAATLQAKINPFFWQDATYYVEYGTGKCSEGGCPLRAPASDALLSDRATSEALKSAKLSLPGLAPATTYHYRFVAQSGGGGPEYGLRPSGEEAVEGSATPASGREGSFRTFALPAQATPCPANEAFRIGASAALPDCRAYELVSPLDKDNGDAARLPNELLDLNQSSLSGERFTYSSSSPFAEPESAPYVSQYLAQRDPAAGWSDENISPPRTNPPGKGLGLAFALHNEFKAFAPELCTAWLAHFSRSALAAGAVPGYVNLYRRQGCSSAPSYDALTTTTPAGRPADHFGGALGVMGFSADESEVAFLADGALTADAPVLNEGLTDGAEPGLQLYVNGPGGLRFACHLPSGSPAGGTCGAGLKGPSADGQPDGKGSAVQGALSADGARLYWTAYARDAGFNVLPGQIYLTANPDQPQSAHLHGSAAGTGTLIGPAAAKCKTTTFSFTVTACQWVSGDFGPGQQVSGSCLAAETTVVSVVRAENKMTLSKKPSAAQSECEIAGAASATVGNLTTTYGAFGPGQEFSGPGVPPGTVVEGASAGSLTLSAAPTKTTVGAAIEANSECTEADKACTVPVSEAVAGKAAAEYWGAAADGSRAIYRIAEGPLKGNVYEFDAASGTSSLIAEGGLAPMGLSEDASRLYFASSKVLGEGAAEGAEAGANNLYLYEAPEGGGEGSFKFVIALAGNDLLGNAVRPSAVNAAPTSRNAAVSSDGLHAAFGSSAPPPSGYDNLDAQSGEAAQEVYLYDAAAEELICASCNPTGARPVGENVGSASEPLWITARLATRRVPLHAPRNLSDDGRRLFFESLEALVPRDTNATWDVYQWEAPGKGGCEESNPAFDAASGGCIDLISSGLSPSGASFLDADPSGQNVFIGTQAGLIAADYGLNDVYDARVGGGFPEPSPPAPECQGEACQSPPAAPEAQTPASEAFHGAGNVREGQARSCPKGKVRKHGRCVRKHRKHHRAHHHRRTHR